jgi:hypothetical protein
MTLGPFLEALLACDLPPAELAARIKTKLPAVNAAELEDLIGLAPPAKLPAVISTYVNGLVTSAKEELKRSYNRHRNRALRQPSDATTPTTSTTLATGQQNNSPRYIDSPPREISEPKKVLKSISTHELPTDFKLTAADVDFALSQSGWDQRHVDLQFSRFCNHYRSRGERRADWSAMWRNWCTNPLSQPERQLPLLHTVGGTHAETNRRSGRPQDWRPGGLGRLSMQLGAQSDPESDFGT